uniref:DUF834 domain-containing protein n=1 Tax=Oryza barthii TaxID=65489 RepID=A0A0D3FTB6_9ORYZ
MESWSLAKCDASVRSSGHADDGAPTILGEEERATDVLLGGVIPTVASAWSGGDGISSWRCGNGGLPRVNGDEGLPGAFVGREVEAGLWLAVAVPTVEVAQLGDARGDDVTRPKIGGGGGQRRQAPRRL